MNSPRKIDAWIVLLMLWPTITLQGNSSRVAKQPTNARGAAIYRKSCSVCHSVEQGETKVGPPLYGVLRDGSGHSEQSVRQIVVQGKGTMPAFKEKFDPEQMNDLIEYLKTL